MRWVRILVYNGPPDWIALNQSKSLSPGLHEFGGSARSIRVAEIPNVWTPWRRFFAIIKEIVWR